MSFGHVEETASLEIQGYSKLMTSQPSEETIIIHILLDISRRELNYENYSEELYFALKCISLKNI